MKRNAGRLRAFSYHEEGDFSSVNEPRQLSSSDILVGLAAANHAQIVHLVSSALLELPSWLGGRLQQLREISLATWNLRHLPSTLFHRNLQQLHLNSCHKLAELPADLGLRASSLQQLFINDCQQLTKLPDTISHLSQLKIAIVTHCSSLESLPNSLGKLQQLHTLILSRCEALTELPSSFSQLSSLQRLELQSCGIASLPEAIQALPSASGTATAAPHPTSQLTQPSRSTPQRSSNSSISHWHSWLPSLQQLDISSCDFLSALPASLGSCTALTQLWVYNPLDQPIPDSICRCQQLVSLKLWNNNLAALPEQLGQLVGLKVLEVGQQKSLEFLPGSVGSLQQLTEL